MSKFFITSKSSGEERDLRSCSSVMLLKSACSAAAWISGRFIGRSTFKDEIELSTISSPWGDVGSRSGVPSAAGLPLIPTLGPTNMDCDFFDKTQMVHGCKGLDKKLHKYTTHLIQCGPQYSSSTHKNEHLTSYHGVDFFITVYYHGPCDLSWMYRNL